MPFNTLILRSEDATQRPLQNWNTASHPISVHSLPDGSSRLCAHRDYPQEHDQMAAPSLSDRGDAGVPPYNSWWNALDCFHTKRGQDRHEMGPVTAAGTA